MGGNTGAPEITYQVLHVLDQTPAGNKFRAYDKATGSVVWETTLPAGTTGGPMTYMFQGKQYVVVTVGARNSPAELIALGLP